MASVKKKRKTNPSSDSSTIDPKPYHHGDLRNALVESAVEILEEEGVQGLTLRKAAARAGVSHSAPYRHFPAKEALIAEISRIGFEELGRRGREYIEGLSNPAERLKAYGQAYIEFAAEKPTHFRIMFGEKELDPKNYPDLASTAEDTFQLLVELVQECQQASLFEEGDPYKLAAANWAFVHGLAHLLVDQKLLWMLESRKPTERARELWARMQDMLMDGLQK
ncbi:MAG: TetR/AcrR family transcriptional regulator [Leptospiraceae bacterium]|nr:TetR/AcrR family transcriptional regulator [Leptospiraceae bacterium]